MAGVGPIYIQFRFAIVPTGTVSVMGRQSGSIFSRRISGLFRISAANLDTNLTDENMLRTLQIPH